MTPARVPGRAVPGLDSDLTDKVLAAAAVVLGAGVLMWLGAAVACWATGRAAPPMSPFAALAALAHPGDPAQAWPRPGDLPGPVAYWSATAVVVAAAVGLAAVAWRHRDAFASAASAASTPVRDLPGLATASEVGRAAGKGQLMRRAAVVRPSTATAPEHGRRRATKPAPGDVGYRIGTMRGRQLWCSVEDSALLVGPPRMGKGLHLVIPWILDAPGPVVTTSTRPDTLAVTLERRRARGPVAVFDPQRLAGLPHGLRWSPVRGCETPRTAMVRARGLAAGAGYGSTVSDSDFWQGQTETALRCLLHAAALDGRSAADLYRWSLNAATAEDAVSILTRDRAAATGWADALDAAVHADPRTRDSVWLGVRQALAALADPDVLDSVDPRERDGFDPATFLAESGTLYLLASAVSSGSCAPLVAAFVEDVTETARAVAARSPGGRLDPPLLLALDEIANLTPLPSLPSLMAEGGGSGITTLAVLQSLAQARHRWGEHAADAIWDAATVKVVLGGLAKMRDLDDVSRLLGDIDEITQTVSRGRGGDRSTSVGVRQVPVMPPSVLRTLPFGTAVLLLRQAKPAVVDMAPWTSRPDAHELAADRTAIESQAAASLGGGGHR